MMVHIIFAKQFTITKQANKKRAATATRFLYFTE